jgi:type-F conjugative transfer system pilin assembly protein TrbC
MLCQQLILGLGLLLAVFQGIASDAENRTRELDSAEAAASTVHEDASRAVNRAAKSAGSDSAFGKEAQRLQNLTPAPLGSIDGVNGTKPGIDLEALMARYGHSTPELSPSASGEQLLIFISASVPRNSLRKLARQAARVDAPLILRGVVDGDLPATAEFMHDILGDGEPRARAMIDPTLFDRFGVKQVPAVVLIPGGACVAGIRACPKVTPAHVHVAGDATLDYILDHIARTHPDSRVIAESFHARLEAKP